MVGFWLLEEECCLSWDFVIAIFYFFYQKDEIITMPTLPANNY
jgi:hypothetical protein